MWILAKSNKDVHLIERGWYVEFDIGVRTNGAHKSKVENYGFKNLTLGRRQDKVQMSGL